MVFVSETYDMPLSPFLSCTDGIIRTCYRDSTSTPSLVGPNPTSLLPGAISLVETVLRPFW